METSSDNNVQSKNCNAAHLDTTPKCTAVFLAMVRNRQTLATDKQILDRIPVSWVKGKFICEINWFFFFCLFVFFVFFNFNIGVGVFVY